jgi:pilus assembly protein CpaB
MQTVVVANKPLRFGTELANEHLKEIAWPTGSLPSGAFEKVSDVLTKDGRRAVLSPIEANEPVMSWKITGPGERATLSAVVTEGMRAISVKINDVLGVAGFVLPGDRVDIMLTRGGDDGSYTDLLLQSVKVLAIDQLADERADKPDVAKTVTIEVDTEDAQKLTLAQTVGTLSLALRKAGHTTAALPRRVTLGDLGPGTKYGDDGKPIPEKAELIAGGAAPATAETPTVGKPGLLDPNAKVGVIRGMAREEYRVPKSELEEVQE